MVNALTIDVEDYFHASALSKVIHRNDWDSVASRVENNTRKLLEIFDEVDTRATFFVLGWVAQRFPELIRDIHARGHEVASHGYSHELIYQQTPGVFREETLKSKQLLEDITGAEVTGYRAASFSITPASEWAIDILIEAGFRYDSSLYPIAHDLYGDRTAPRFPYWRQGTGEGGLIEFPISTLQRAGVRIPVGGGGYFRLFPYPFVRWALASVNKSEKMPFIFYLHPWELDHEQPRLPVSGLSRFRHYNNLHRCEARLRRLLADFEFTTCEQVLDQLSLAPARGESTAALRQSAI
ncbi:MAG: DUF3473 domain-containing protein [Proteobacteria bacterium]|nr:DUF3473 domain-containing protein [Pseudomonadota bacterium]